MLQKICTDNFLCLYDKRIHAGSKEIDKILEAEKGLASELDKKMEQSMRDQNQDSVEESWLSMLVDFYVPNRLLQQQPWWLEWEPATGRVKHEHNTTHLGSSLEAVRDAMNEESRHFFMIEERMTDFERFNNTEKLHHTISTLHGSSGFIETAPYIVITILSRLTLLGRRRENIGQLGRLRFSKVFLKF
jgi:hypothetical protein